MNFDEILLKCGNSHRYQFLLLGLFSFLMFITSMQYFSQNVIGFVPDHWCYHEQLENLSFSQIADIYKDLENPSCTKLATIDLAGGNYTISEDRCDRWIYNYDFGFRSMSTELNWVCDDAYKSPVGQSFFFAGSILGTVIFGLLGDRIGRIKGFILANWCGFLGDFLTIFADNLTVFSLTRFVSGLAIDANTYLMYILVVEYVSPTLRSSGLTICVCVFFGLGMTCTSWLAVFVGYWKYFLLCSSIPMLGVTLYYFLVQESAQWLITRNDIDGAIKRLQHVAKTNRRRLSDSDVDAFRNHCLEIQHKENEKDIKGADMFKTPHLRKKIILVLSLFSIMSLCFNTMTRNVEGLGISPFITFSIFAVTLLPAGLLQAGVQKRFGRKSIAVASLLFTGLFSACSGIIMSIAKDLSTVLLVTINVVGRFGISMCYGAILLISTELIPTCIRSRGLSLAHLAGSAISIFSPYILHIGTYYRAGPAIVLCLLFLFNTFLCLLLPETKDRKLPITLADGENFGKGERMFDFLKTSSKKETAVESELDAAQKLMS